MDDEPKLIRPAKRLGDEPIVATENDILLAFDELSWIEHKHATAAKLQNAELDAIRKKYLKHFQVDSHATAAEGQPAPQSLDERRGLLASAIEQYAREHKAELITEKLKTHDFGTGTVAFKLAQQSLMPLRAIDADGNVDESPASKLLEVALNDLLTANKIPEAVERKLKTKPDGLPRPLSDFLRVEFTWDAKRIVSLASDGLLKNDALTSLGIKVDRAPERIEIRLKV